MYPSKYSAENQILREVQLLASDLTDSVRETRSYKKSRLTGEWPSSTPIRLLAFMLQTTRVEGGAVTHTIPLRNESEYSAQYCHARFSAVPRRYDDASYSRNRIMEFGGCIPNIIGSRSTQTERITPGIPI